MTTLTVPRLSQSRHERLKCAASYVYSEMYGYASTDNEANLLGSEVHSILYSWALHNWREKNTDTDQIHLARLLSCASADAQEMIKHFLEMFGLDFSKIVALECTLLGGDELEGTLDVLLNPGPGSYNIVDYKSQHQIIEADTFQSKLYPLLVFLSYPDAKVVGFELAFTRYGCTRRVTYTRDDVPRLMELIQASRTRQLDIHANPQKYEKEACPGKVCIYCPLLRMRECPIEGRNPYEMSIEERLQWQEYMKRAMKDNAEKLKEHAENKDLVAISTDGRQLKAGFVAKETKQYPFGPATALLVEWKEDTGDDLISGLHVSYSSLRAKLKAKKRAVLDQAMDEIAETKTNTEFELREEA